MSYNFNSIPNINAIGTVLQYAGSATPDPPGWVICDGVSRSNASGQYNNILTSQLGTNPIPSTSILNAPFNSAYSLSGNNNGFGDWSTIMYSTQTAISKNGNIMAASNTNGGANTNRGIYISTDTGINWTKKYGGSLLSTDLPYMVSMSLDGSKILTVVGGTLHLTTDYGSYWKSILVTSIQYPIAYISGNGNVIGLSDFVGYGNIRLSTNGGNTFTYYSPSQNGLSSTGNIGAITMNPSGSVILMSINLSTNGGASWTGLPFNGDTVRGLTVSNDGKYMLAGDMYNINKFYFSTDTGKNWQNISSTRGLSNSTYFSPTMSGDGQIMLVNTTSNVYISSNYGTNWSILTVPAAMITAGGGSLNISNDGTKAIGVGQSNPIHISTAANTVPGYNYFSSFTPISLANTTSTDGATLKYIMKY
uniref:Phage tail collar domain-containing protein n=1 Tax=viral metagenome TaxID=1070528 RepID=A0A6C0JGY8_9ZZZZ